MNEKVAKKVGEAHAFSKVFQDLKNQTTEEILLEMVDQNTEEIIEKTNTLMSDLGKISKQFQVEEIVTSKSERTVKKIKGMGESYVGDEWDNPVEVLEWLSFLIGGAVIHWRLIEGSAKAMKSEKFVTIASFGAEYFTEIFEKITEKAAYTGKKRAEQ